jgi:hypothetical protein
LFILLADLILLITIEEIKNAVKRLKNGKSSGIDGVINEYIKYIIDDMLHIYVFIASLVENPFLKSACALVINSNSSENFVNLLFKTAENILYEFSVTSLFELGSDFDHLFCRFK